MTGSAAALLRTHEAQASPEEWRDHFAGLDLIHEVELRASGGWPVLAEASRILANAGCELVSANARRYGDGAETISLRFRVAQEALAETLAERLRTIAGVDSAGLSHHLGRGQSRSPRG
jgi:hypothetical protein